MPFNKSKCTVISSGSRETKYNYTMIENHTSTVLNNSNR